MQKLTMQVTAVTENGKQHNTLTRIVASTKSANNLKEELAENDIFVKSTKVEPIFLNRDNVELAVIEMVKSELDDNELSDAVSAHIMKALDGACVFYRPITRK